jgi:membrane-bound lytic murein transglycosylase D
MTSSILRGALLLAALLAGCATAPPEGPPPAAAAASAPDVVVVQVQVPASAASGVVAVLPPEPQTPAPPPTAVDPLYPEVRLDLADRAARRDLWERVRAGFAMPDLDDEMVRERERWYATRPDYVQRMTDRGSRYLFHIVEELDKRGMPMELALLPFIESAFNPQAMSSAKASGMWQFMPGTGRDFELRQNLFRDDRRDVLASTRAALDYLQKLYAMFGDWHLALAAYNWGEGSVQRALAANQRAKRPADYVSLRMPAETRLYVRKLQAVKNIVLRPSDFGLTLPDLANHPYFVAVGIERDIDVELAAQLAELPLDEFKALNPQMNQPVILAAGTPRVLLPYDNANLFVRRLPLHRGPMASWTAWVVPKTLRPVDAAKQLGMSEEQLREVNRIPPRMLVQAGSTLLVLRNGHRYDDVSGHLADHATIALTPDGPTLRKVALRAGARDSVASVAKRYRVSVAQVAQWNEVAPTARFRPGQTIVVFVAGKASKNAKASASTRKPAAASPKRPTAKSARRR